MLNLSRYSSVHRSSAEQNVHRTRWISPCSWTLRTSFTLILALPFPLILTPSLELPTSPAFSSSPSMFWVYERRSLRLVSRVLMKRWVGDGEATSMERFSCEMNV